MQPVTIEFNVRSGDQTFREDAVTFRSVEELYEFVAPGGDCEKMSSELGEIQMTVLSDDHPNKLNPIADKRGTLQLGMVFITGPLAIIVQFLQELIDKVGRNEVSDSFLAAIHACN
jgi:hypothetical protein